MDMIIKMRKVWCCLEYLIIKDGLIYIYNIYLYLYLSIYLSIYYIYIYIFDQNLMQNLTICRLHAQKKDFQRTNLGKYDLYFQMDMLLPADVFQNFQNMCLVI